MKKILKSLLLLLLLINAGGPLLVLMSGDVSMAADWRNADRNSTGIAPLPAQTTAAVVQVYAARAYNWRGYFAVHTWIATKEEDADTYRVHHVLGWNERRGLPVVVSGTDAPDRAWYGYQPEIILDLRGAEAAAVIDRIETAVATYPYQDSYTAWPGPNSNTFIAHIGRQVPELALRLPPTAIGKDYPLQGRIIDKPASGSGLQFSFFGLFGILISDVEGLEINLLGLVTGIDFAQPALKLPGIGRIDFAGG